MMNSSSQSANILKDTVACVSEQLSALESLISFQKNLEIVSAPGLAGMLGNMKEQLDNAMEKANQI